MKHRFLFIIALLLTAASAWADDEPAPIDLTYDATAGAWTYSQPEYDVELEMKGMLCISGEIGGDANEPAYAPDLGEELNVDLSEELDPGL